MNSYVTQSFWGVLYLCVCPSDEPAVSVYGRTAEDPGTLLREWDDQSEQGLLPANTAMCSGGQTGLQRGPGKMCLCVCE